MELTPEEAAAQAIDRSWRTAQRIQADPELMAHLRDRIVQLDARTALSSRPAYGTLQDVSLPRDYELDPAVVLIPDTYEGSMDEWLASLRRDGPPLDLPPAADVLAEVRGESEWE